MPNWNAPRIVVVFPLRHRPADQGGRESLSLRVAAPLNDAAWEAVTRFLADLDAVGGDRYRPLGALVQRGNQPALRSVRTAR